MIARGHQEKPNEQLTRMEERNVRPRDEVDVDIDFDDNDDDDDEDDENDENGRNITRALGHVRSREIASHRASKIFTLLHVKRIEEPA